MTSPFEPMLCPPSTLWSRGYASGPGLSSHKVADKVLKESLPGEWLTCYMIRRFGWPNIGSDPDKDLCSWMLTTPLEGLYLVVSPYLGKGNLHFAIRFTQEVEEKLHHDPELESYLDQRWGAIRTWWADQGSKLYALGVGKNEGDEDELVHLYGETREGLVGGLWRRPLKVERAPDPLPEDAMVFWWLGDFIKENHPEMVLPIWRKRAPQKTEFQLQAEAAVEATIRSLLRPIFVRDLMFNPFGYGKGEGTEAPRHEDAGYGVPPRTSPVQVSGQPQEEQDEQHEARGGPACPSELTVVVAAPTEG